MSRRQKDVLGKVWEGIVTQNFRLQCFIRPADIFDKDAPSGPAFFRSQLTRNHPDQQERSYLGLTPVVGDIVDYTLTQNNELIIFRIHPRVNSLSRQHAGVRFIKKHIIAANLDGIILCQSIVMPVLRAGFVDRILVFAESQNFKLTLVWTKLDLLLDKNLKNQASKELQKIKQIYSELPYKNFFIGKFNENLKKDELEVQDFLRINLNRDSDDMENFKDFIKMKRWVILGNSGVGKSTLIRKLTKNTDIRIGDVNTKIKKGRHTTSQACLYPIEGGGELIDTPGLREFGLLRLDSSQISWFFPEFHPYLNGCRLSPCSHQHEPDCKVIQAVEDKKISRERFSSYLKIIQSIDEIPKWKKNRSTKKAKKSRYLKSDRRGNS